MKLLINFFLAFIFICSSAYGETVTLGPAYSDGWSTCGYMYNQNNTSGTYQIAIGQTFKTPSTASGIGLDLTGFSMHPYAEPYYNYAQMRFRVYDSLDRNIILYEYVTGGDRTKTNYSDKPDYYWDGGKWLVNRGGELPDWMFRDYDFGRMPLRMDTEYYFEVEFLKQLDDNDVSYMRAYWGRSQGDVGAYSDWTYGQAYQRWSDSTVDAIAPPGGNQDLNFKMEFRVTKNRVSIGPAQYSGYSNCGYVYNQATVSGTYESGIGQTFTTPYVPGDVLKLTGFSLQVNPKINNRYGNLRFRVWDSIAKNTMYYEYTTANDPLITYPADKPDAYFNNYNWLVNRTDKNATWMFRDWDFGSATLAENTQYYWEIEYLNQPGASDCNYFRAYWGVNESGGSAGNWTTGAAYQRYSDGSVVQLLSQYGNLDTNFKMEFEYEEPNWTYYDDPADYNLPEVSIFPSPKVCDFTFEKIEFGTNIKIVLPENPGSVLDAAITDACDLLRQKGVTITEVNETSYLNASNGFYLVIDVNSPNKLVSDLLELRETIIQSGQPGTHGYIIDDVNDEGRTAFIVAGSDDAGALYGVYSWIQLVSKFRDGFYVNRAHVWDEPNYTGRMMMGGYSTPPDRVKWAARLRYTHAFYGDDETYTNDGRTEVATDRNYRMGTSTGYYFHWPEISHSCVYAESTGFFGETSRNCWGDTNHQLAIHNEWQSVCSRKSNFIPWHDATDAGTWTKYNSEFWPTRCSYCTAAYPQSTPCSADAVRFADLINIRDTNNSNAQIAFTIPCYYSDPGQSADHRTYLQAIAAACPNDGSVLFICENQTPSATQNFKDNLLGRPLIMYQYAHNGEPGNWTERFTLIPDYLGTCDMYCWCIGGYEADLLIAMGSQYLWRTNTPVDEYTIYEDLVPQASCYLFGDAWRPMAKWFTSDIEAADYRYNLNTADLNSVAVWLGPVVSDMMDWENVSLGEAKESITANLNITGPLFGTVKYRKPLSEVITELKELINIHSRINDKNSGQTAYNIVASHLSDFNDVKMELIDLGILTRCSEIDYVPLAVESVIDIAACMNSWLTDTTPARSATPRWKIGNFDGSQNEFTGLTKDYSYDPKANDPCTFPANHSSGDSDINILFTDSISNGALLHVVALGDGFKIAIDGDEFGASYLPSESFEEMWIVIPAVSDANHLISIISVGTTIFDALELYSGQAPVLMAENLTIGPPSSQGYSNCGYIYNQENASGTYPIAVGQTFKTPLSKTKKMRLTGFSCMLYGTPYWNYAQLRLKVWDSTARNILYYSYTTAGDTSKTNPLDRPDHYWDNGVWTANRNGDNKTWLFRDWDFGNVELSQDTTYYWELEFLQQPGADNDCNYLRVYWGGPGASTDWTDGAAYQRYSDGAVEQILPQYGACDTMFKMEFTSVYKTEVVSIDAPSVQGYSTCGYIYNQENASGTYMNAVGQTFVAPALSYGTKMKLTGFSAMAYAEPYWNYGKMRFKVWDSTARNTLYYSYTTAGDVSKTDPADRPDYYWTNGNWMVNRQVHPDWMFRDYDLGSSELNPNSSYYWELEFLEQPGDESDCDYMRLYWGGPDASTNWTSGAAYQRYSDGTVAAIYSSCDAMFKMEFTNYYRDPLALFIDSFETNFDKWTDGGATDWDRATDQKYSGSYAARATSVDNDLISDNINTAGYNSMTITFWYRDDDIDNDDDVYLQLCDGTTYDNKYELGNSTEDTWHKYEVTVHNSGSDAQYFTTNFRIKFEATSIDTGENLWIDDVSVKVQ